MHHASSTFTMDESLGSARVKVQYGDGDEKLEVTSTSHMGHTPFFKKKKKRKKDFTVEL